MTDPRTPDPRHIDPNYPSQAPHTPYGDPAADPRISDRPVYPDRGRGGLIAAGVIAVLLVIALIAFSTGPATDPGTTAVIPDQTEEIAPGGQVAPAPDTSAPLDEAPAADQ